MTATSIPRIASYFRTVPLDRMFVAMIAVSLALKLHLVFLLNINWDEFLHLAKVHEYLRGELTAQLQTFHVHLFAWLRWVSESEVDQIVAARLVMFALGLGSALLTYAIARRFCTRTGALFAVLCYLSFSYLIEHGTSFRADPMAAPLFLAAVYLVLRRDAKPIDAAAAGLILALSLMLTIKAIFHVAAIGVILLCFLATLRRRKRTRRAMAAFAAACVTGFAILYGIHGALLPPVETEAQTRMVAATYQKMISFDAMFPGWRYLVVGFGENIFFWLALAGGAAVTVGRGLRADGSIRAWNALAFLAPLVTLAIYRNTFPYYYVFILSPAVVLCGCAADWLAKPRKALGQVPPSMIVAVLFVIIFGTMVTGYWQHGSDRMAVQRDVVGAVHRMFPEPVPYIDRASMIATYPKVGMFMSTWGMENYLARGAPIFDDLLRRRQPQFLLANVESLDLSRPREEAAGAMGYRLMEADYRALRANFVPHWGIVWVAGKTLALGPQAASRDFEILIGGLYTVEAPGPVTIDGAPFAPGETVRLDQGPHRLKAAAAATAAMTVVLRWGDHLYRPAREPLPGPVFTGF